MPLTLPEQYRQRDLEEGYWSTLGTGLADFEEVRKTCGVFIVPVYGHHLRCIASTGGLDGGLVWEHLSVSHQKAQLPTWNEMCALKDLFWDPEDCVMQLHPPLSEYVNCHPRVLHLWRPVGVEIPRPPKIMV